MLPEIEFSINATYQKTIGKSPAEAIFGRNIRRENTKPKLDPFKNIQTNRSFNVGDEVYVKREVKNKDEDRYEGPGKVQKRIHDRSYLVNMEDGRSIVRNVEWLKPSKRGGCDA